MLHLIENQHRDTIHPWMIKYHIMRCKIFCKILGCPLKVEKGLEKDEYDNITTKHLLSIYESRVVGSIRFVQTTGPYMIKEHFPQSVYEPDRLPNDSKTWEMTRLCYANSQDKRKVGLSKKGTIELLIGAMEFGVFIGLERFIAFTGVGIETMLKNMGWHIERLGDVEEFHGKDYVVAYFPVSKELLRQIREKTNIDYPLFETPLSVTLNQDEDAKIKKAA